MCRRSCPGHIFKYDLVIVKENNSARLLAWGNGLKLEEIRGIGVGKLDKPKLFCFQRRLCPIPDFKLAQDVGQVILHSTFGYEQLSGDLFIGGASGNDPHDFQLSF